MMELSIKQVFEQGMAAYNECKFQKAESLYHRVLENIQRILLPIIT